MAGLIINGSSSKGNSYIIETSKGKLLLELGVKFDDILKGLNYKLDDVVGCLVSHIHSDHSKSIPDALKFQMSVYSNQDVADKFKGVKVLKPKHKYRIGCFIVQPLEVEHNVPNYAYIIDNEETGRILFYTDCVYFPYNVKNVNHILGEINYSNEIAIDRLFDGYEIKSHNEYHMELEDSLDALKRLDNPYLKNVICIHLSDGQSNEEMFAKRIYEDIGIHAMFADKGMKVELNKDDF